MRAWLDRTFVQSRFSGLVLIALLLAPETKDVDYDADLGVGATGSL